MLPMALEARVADELKLIMGLGEAKVSEAKVSETKVSETLCWRNVKMILPALDVFLKSGARGYTAILNLS